MRRMISRWLAIWANDQRLTSSAVTGIWTISDSGIALTSVRYSRIALNHGADQRHIGLVGLNRHPGQHTLLPHRLRRRHEISSTGRTRDCVLLRTGERRAVRAADTHGIDINQHI